MDGQQVVNNNFFQAATNRTGTITLSPGFHTIDVFYYQGAAQEGLQVFWQPPGAAAQSIIPNSVLYAGDTYDATQLPLTVTANSTLNIGSAVANVQSLTQTGGTTLSILGSANFGSTTVSGAGALGISNTLGSVNLGPITGNAGQVINKSGDGALVFSNAPSAGYVINDNAGLVVSQGSESGGVTTDPLSGATINLNGGGLGFSASSGNPTYSPATVSFSNDGSLAFGQFGSGNTAATTITLQPASGVISVAGSHTVTLDVPDANVTANISATLGGAGNYTINEGAVNLQGPSSGGASVNNTGNLTIHTAQVNAASDVTTGALAVDNSYNGSTGAGTYGPGSLTVGGTLTPRASR